MQETDPEQATRRQVVASGLGLTGTVLSGGPLSTNAADDTPSTEQARIWDGNRRSDDVDNWNWTARSEDTYAVHAEDDALTVAQPPRDMDGDSLFEDVDGDGAFRLEDIYTFCADYGDDLVATFASAFDYDGDRSVTRADRRSLQRYLTSAGNQLHTVEGSAIDVNVFAHPDV